VTTETRCIVDLGDIRRPTSIRHTVERIINIAVRSQVEYYLTRSGVVIGRSEPAKWFGWIDVPEPGALPGNFFARCADPPDPNALDDGYQPWNYFVIAEIQDRTGIPWRAHGRAFRHDSSFRP
jgi:hypothetical protein